MPTVWRLLGAAWRWFWRIALGVTLQPLPGWLGWREHLYRLFCRVVFALRLQDMNCAFRLFRRDIFARIPIQSRGDFVHTEILAKANFLGCYMNDEVPLTYRPREGAAGGDVAGWVSGVFAAGFWASGVAGACVRSPWRERGR